MFTLPGLILLEVGNAIFSTLNVMVVPQFHGQDGFSCENMVMKVISTSEMPECIYKATWHNILENLSLQQHHC